MTSIFTVTTYRRDADRKVGKHVCYDFRTVGWWDNLEDAIYIVEHNCGDLEEAGWYRWAVVEEFPIGLYGIGEHMDPIWFEYQGNDMWARIDVKPHNCPAEIKAALGGFDRMVHWGTLG